MFSSHALRTTIHYDFHKILIASLIVSILVINIRLFSFNFRKKSKKYLWDLFVICFILYISLQAFFTKSYFKYFEILAILSLLLLPSVINFRSDYVKAIRIICLPSVVLQSLILIFNKTHIYSFGINYLLISALTPVVICYFYIQLWNREIMYERFIYFMFFLISLIGILNVQGRYSVLISLIGIVLISIYNWRRLFFKFEGFLICTLFVVSYPWIVSFLDGAAAVKRTLEFIYSGEKLDRIEILELYGYALKNVWITGFGIGQTPIFPPYYYPHNFIVEFITEFGIIGGAFTLLLLISVIVRMRHLTLRKPDDAFIICIMINYTFFFLKSGSIYDSYPLFAAFSLVIIGSNNYVQGKP